MRLCHACHVKPSATPATQSAAASQATNGDQRRPSAPRSAISATPATQNQGGDKVDVSLCHACHAEPRWRQGGCLLVTRLPRKTKVDVTKCHACHAKCRGVTGDQRRPSVPRSAISATPATHHEGRCESVPRLPRETKCHACHAKCCGVTGDQRRPSVPRSATPATQNQGGDKVDVSLCHQARHAVP